MRVTRLALDHYRSWAHCIVDFADGVNILVGANGLGKTNIVEALEVLSTGSSHRTSSSLPLIQRDCHTATIRANVTSDDGEQTTTYEVSIRDRGANRARINGGNSLYMREVVGQVPCVTFAPEDQRLVMGEPAYRRGFLDQTAALLVPGYVALMQQFTHIAKQRATLLKQLSQHEHGMPVDAMMSGLEVWTGQFVQVGMELTRCRLDVIRRLDKPFQTCYRDLAGDTQCAGLQYEPSFEEVVQREDPALEISAHFQRLYVGEVSSGRNLIGPHRDDIRVLLRDMDAREFASNGETWTLALALKMAVFELIHRERGVMPMMILDDVFSQLDDNRRQQILHMALNQGQVLITAASAHDIPDIDVADSAMRNAHIIDVAQFIDCSGHNDVLALPVMSQTLSSPASSVEVKQEHHHGEE